MSKSEKPQEEKPQDWQMAATPALEQVRTGIAQYFDLVKSNMSKMPWGANDQVHKMIELTEANLDATVDHLEALTKARTFADVARIQGEFVSKQMQTFTQQMMQLSQGLFTPKS